MRFLARIGAPAADVEDLTQEVFVVAHRRRATWDPTRPLRPWLFGIACNLARDQRRRDARTESLEGHPEPGATDPGIRKVEAAQLVHRALRMLPDVRREVFVLHELEGIPVVEVAAALGIPADTAYGRLRTARDEFRTAVTRLQRGAA